MITGKRVLVFALLLFIIVSLCACSEDGGGYGYEDVFKDIELETTTSAEEEKELRYYDVIVTSDCSSEVYGAAKSLCEKLERVTGYKAFVYYEYEMPNPAELHTYVFVGDIGNSVCRRNYEDYRSEDYGYCFVDGAILIGGVTDKATLAAIESFEAKVLPKADPEKLMDESDAYIYRADYEVKDSLKLNGFALSEYRIVYLSGDADAAALAKEFSEKIEDSFGYSLSVSSENESDTHARSICVGRTLRADTLGYQPSEIESSIMPYSTGISVLSDSVFGIKLGLERLYSLLSEAGDNGASVTAAIDITFSKQGVIIDSMKFLSESLDIGEILSVCNDIRASEADVMRVTGLSAKSFDYVARNLANEYKSLSVAKKDGDFVRYLYKIGTLDVTVSTLSGDDAELVLLEWRDADRSFTLAELSVLEGEGSIGKSLCALELDRLVIFGRFYGDDEAEFLDSCDTLSRLYHNELSFGLYATELFTKLVSARSVSATESEVTRLCFDFFSE